jgi:hypothetical protein
VSELTDFFARRALASGAQLAPFVTRPINPVTGASIPQHPGAPSAPVPPSVTEPFAGETTLLNTANSPAAPDTSGNLRTWTAFSGTPFSASGTFTSASYAGRYLRIGNTLWLSLLITITTNGSAAVNVRFVLPNSSISHSDAVWSAYEAATAWSCYAFIGPSQSIVQIRKYDGSYPTDGGNGRFIVVNGSLEVN